MKITELKGKKILIVGYGKEGRSTEAFLKIRAPDAKITITDEKDGESYLKNQQEFDVAVRSPGVPKEQIKILYTTATNIFFANKGEREVIGVTGTKGKSTTAALIHHIFTESGKHSQFIGNIGAPMLDSLINESSPDTIYVCELSSYQLDDIKYSPHVAVVVSLFFDHVPYHKSLEKYYDAKKNIIRFQTQKDYYIYNPKFSALADWTKVTKAIPLPYREFQVASEIPLKGEHNHDNIRAAATVAKLYDISDEIIHNALNTFKSLPHRLENVGIYNGITFYDDAISTTPESTVAALETIKNVKTIFLGGEDRDYDFNFLIKSLKSHNVENIVLFPDTGARIKQLLENEKDYHPNIFETQDMRSAVNFAFKNTPKGTVCLLSTASPSYSLWKNFDEKGSEFQKFIREGAT